MSARPARLTFPVWDMGATRIVADGRHDVGRVLGEFYGWRARLWPEADMKAATVAELDSMETAWFRTLREAREALRKRVADEGPWWS